MSEEDWDDEDEYGARWVITPQLILVVAVTFFMLLSSFLLGRCSVNGAATEAGTGTDSTRPLATDQQPAVTSTSIASTTSSATLPVEETLPSVASYTAPPGTDSRMLRRVNEEREREGLSALTWCPALARAAEGHSVDMADRQYFEHESPDGLQVWDRVRAEGYDYSSVGENIAVGQESVVEVMDGWMDSPGHRANILSPDYEHFGLGIRTGNYSGRRAIYWTQNFGSGGDCR